MKAGTYPSGRNSRAERGTVLGQWTGSKQVGNTAEKTGTGARSGGNAAGKSTAGKTRGHSSFVGAGWKEVRGTKRVLARRICCGGCSHCKRAIGKLRGGGFIGWQSFLVASGIASGPNQHMERRWRLCAALTQGKGQPAACTCACACMGRRGGLRLACWSSSSQAVGAGRRSWGLRH
jgi:hypothetical protein